MSNTNRIQRQVILVLRSQCLTTVLEYGKGQFHETVESAVAAFAEMHDLFLINWHFDFAAENAMA